jgi:cytochrome d ubiquinol oxidase subunit II
MALGNIIFGIPLNKNGNYAGTFFELLNPFAILTGLLSRRQT